MKKIFVLAYLLLIGMCIAAAVLYRTRAGAPDCLSLTDGQVQSDGKLILESRKEGVPSQALDLKSGERQVLENVTPYTVVVSRNGWLAYYDYEQDAPVVLLPDGTSRPLAAAAQLTPLGWASSPDGTPLLLLWEQETEEQDGQLWAYSPSDDTKTLLDIGSIPNLKWVDAPRWGMYSAAGVVPDPSLAYAVYAADDEPGFPLVLWDMKAQREIARVHWGDAANTPQWAPDGQSFVTAAPPASLYEGTWYKNVDDGLPYVGGTELFRVGLDGKVRRLTTYTASFKAGEEMYKWSPDGTRIAFVLTLDEERRLVILSMADNGQTVFCFPQEIGEMASPPVWSPDGSFLALTFQDESLRMAVRLMDVQRRVMAEIISGAEAVGWVTASAP